MYIYANIFTKGRTRHSASYAHLHRVSSLCTLLASHVHGWLPKDGTGRNDTGGVTREWRRRERVTRETWEKKKGGRKRKKKKETTSTSFLSRLSGRTVCILSRAAPREFNSIFNLPKPLYANSATDVEYFWTFSTLFCVPSVRRRYVPPLFVLLHGTASFHSSSSSERRHTFPSLLASFTNVASRIFGRVLNKAAEREREKIGWTDSRATWF